MDPRCAGANDLSTKFLGTFLYRSLIVALLHVAVNARPDITVRVPLLVEKLVNGLKWKSAKRVVRYLNGTLNLGLSFESEKTDTVWLLGR